MNQFEAVLIVAAILGLRLAIPLTLTLVFGIGMNRLLERWSVEPES